MRFVEFMYPVQIARNSFLVSLIFCQMVMLLRICLHDMINARCCREMCRSSGVVERYAGTNLSTPKPWQAPSCSGEKTPAIPGRALFARIFMRCMLLPLISPPDDSKAMLQDSMNVLVDESICLIVIASSCKISRSIESSSVETFRSCSYIPSSFPDLTPKSRPNNQYSSPPSLSAALSSIVSFFSSLNESFMEGPSSPVSNPDLARLPVLFSMASLPASS